MLHGESWSFQLCRNVHCRYSGSWNNALKGSSIFISLWCGEVKISERPLGSKLRTASIKRMTVINKPCNFSKVFKIVFMGLLHFYWGINMAVFDLFPITSLLSQRRSEMKRIINSVRANDIFDNLTSSEWEIRESESFDILVWFFRIL